MERSGLAAQVSKYDIPDLSIADAAALMGCNPLTVRRRIADGSLPAFRVGGLIRIRRDDVAALFTAIPAARGKRRRSA